LWYRGIGGRPRPPEGKDAVSMRPLAVIALLASAWLPVGCRKRPASSLPSTRPGARGYDEEVAGAWAVADRLGRAWLGKDVQAARGLMTPGLIARTSDERIEDFIAGAPNHRHAAWDITAASRRTDGRIEFTLRLTVEYCAQIDPHTETHEETVILARSAGVWLVDELPRRASRP
jgi:hypothetical protein